MSSRFCITLISKNLSDHRAIFTAGIQLLDSSAWRWWILPPSPGNREMKSPPRLFSDKIIPSMIISLQVDPFLHVS